MISTHLIQEKLQLAFSKAQVQVSDLTGTEDHFSVEVITPDFEKKSLVLRHQAVYAALGDLVTSGKIHALSITAMTPLEKGQENHEQRNTEYTNSSN